MQCKNELEKEEERQETLAVGVIASCFSPSSVLVVLVAAHFSFLSCTLVRVRSPGQGKVSPMPL